MQAATEPTPIAGEDSHRTKGILRLTMACNERCPFCNVPAEDYDKLTPPEDQADAELQAFLDAGAATLTISGGEPTLLRKRLIRLLRKARAGGIHFIELQTNATLITPEYAAEMADAGLTSAFVSLLSHVPELHDDLAGLAGAYPKCLDGIDNLINAGVRVTLNPVTARTTQHLVADYLDFVAERLPDVRFISMSAVQPHGRAREYLDLLPDYAVLSGSIREARARAEVHGIELVNPYCGLPLCIGWDDDPDHSVEAFEATGGGWKRTPGIENLGDKSQGAPCTTCAVRTRCGGAWHAYWQVRDGSGIVPPVHTVEPWLDQADAAPAQEVWRGALPSLVGRAPEQPTVWWWTDTLAPGDAGRLLQSPVTDVAWETDVYDPAALRDALGVLRRLTAAGRQLQPQQRIRVQVGLRANDSTNPAAVWRVASLATALGVDGVRILADDRRWQRIAERLQQEHPQASITWLRARSLRTEEA